MYGHAGGANYKLIFACGDFNQRITIWGIKSLQELHWVWPDIGIREVVVSYRQSRQLLELPLIAELWDQHSLPASLPEYIDNEGVEPTLAMGLSDRKAIIKWLARRVIEIESADRASAVAIYSGIG